jgi:uncharacterized protein (DUF433 family)
MKCPVIIRDLEIMGGTPVFRGTRVPIQTLLDYIEAGETIDDFLEGFPSVSREQGVAFLEEAKNALAEPSMRRRYTLDEPLAASDPKLVLTDEDQKWLSGKRPGGNSSDRTAAT